ncbi:MAG: anthranilate phosphoribosyltransferase [Deltaproteobacteria bacterium]|nr:anthranilate phosphoribosyltransferase [Deltaproteobacteria bacterium]
MEACRTALRALVAGQTLSSDAAEQAMGEVLAGQCSPTLVAGLLTALARRPETADELSGFARAVRKVANPLPGAEHALCPCGTGGSGLETANTSTSVAFVLAAAGVPVAKHGNRAASGRCGSADVLEQLGIAVDVPLEVAGEHLRDLGLAFLFAPRAHPALRQLAPIRRELGFSTVFNVLGPMCNPASVRRQVLGVADRRRAEPMVRALQQLGSERVLAVSGHDGLDELSLSAPSQVVQLHDGQVTVQTWTPEEAGLARVAPEQLRGGDAATNAVILLDVLAGRPSAHADLTALNAGAGLLLAGRAADLREGVNQAKAVLVSGAARDLLERYRERCAFVRAA